MNVLEIQLYRGAFQRVWCPARPALRIAPGIRSRRTTDMGLSVERRAHVASRVCVDCGIPTVRVGQSMHAHKQTDSPRSLR